MNPNATFGIAITADDKTAKGFNSAEKRGKKTASTIGQSNKAWAKAAQDNIGGGSRGIIGNLGRVEKAATRAFSGMSGLGGGSGGIIGQLGAVRSMAGLAGEGLGSAAGEAGLLEAGLIGIGGAAVATGAVVVGLAAGMVKLSDSWGKGANNLGNMASLIGVSTEGLQKFAGAAERVGVDKDTAMGAIGGLSQSLNDARYGRNNAALSVLGRLGVKMQTNQDGTVNVEAMLPAIATALQGQNSSGRRTAARALGISDGALAAFTQGGKALSADMADYGQNGAVVTDADTKLGRALTERDTKAAQWMGKGMLAAQRANAGIVKGAGDAIIGAANGTSPIGMPSLIGSADAQTLPTAGGSDNAWGGAAGGGFGRGRKISAAGLTPEAIAAAQQAQRRWGVPASVQLAQYGAESSFGRRMPHGSNNPFGIKARAGQPSVIAPTTEVDRWGGRHRVHQPFRAYNSLEESFDDHARFLAQSRATKEFRAALPDVNAAVAELGGGTKAHPRYATENRDKYTKLMRSELADHNLQQYDVNVHVQLSGGRPGDSAVVTHGPRSRPKISKAADHQ